MAVTKTFQAEVNQVLQLITHSMYSKREIFIRELISNASDAIEKRSFLGLSDAKVLEGFDKGAIYVVPDEKAGTITFSDNGIGMDESDLDENLGTIARSGTKAFLDGIKQAKDESDKTALIGQFGVGFYSAFVVADNSLAKSILKWIPKKNIEAICRNGWNWQLKNPGGFYK